MLGYRKLDFWGIFDYYFWLTIIFGLVVAAYLGPLVIGSICIWKSIAFGDPWLSIIGSLLIWVDVLFWIDSAGQLKTRKD